MTRITSLAWRTLAVLVLGSRLLPALAAEAAALPADAPTITGDGSPGDTYLPNKGMAVSTEVGFGIFQNVCLACHGKPEIEKAPTPAQLRSFAPERIYAALTTGVMKAVGDTLTDTQRKIVSQAVAGRLFGATPAGDADHMANHCAANPPVAEQAKAPAWNGWGNGAGNARFQDARSAGLDATRVAGLKLKWAFGLPNATSSYSQPTVALGRLFVASDSGYIYALDARSGCVHWSFLADGAVRNAMTVEPLPARDRGPVRYGVFFGDLKANVYGLDAQTGELLWKQHVDDNYTTRITAPPAYHDGRLFVPVSSWEEFSARSLDYACCTSVGSIVALDAATGAQAWKTYVIPQRPTPTRKNSKGVQQYGPAGGSIWNTPAVDARRHAIYFGTGDATTFPAVETSDAIMALDMRDGHMLWSYQVTPEDSFLVGCARDGVTDNCPEVEGPDWDIPVSPILTRHKGREMVVVATKPGDVVAVDPARGGKLVWRSNVNGPLADPKAPPPAPGTARPPGIMWGGAVLDGKVYYGLTAGGKLAAMDLGTGKAAWLAQVIESKDPVSLAAPATAIPGVVFLGASNGQVSAVAAGDGHVLWSYDTNREFDAINKVPAHGGTIGSPGVAVAGGMVYVASGYSVLGRSLAGNVVLAFGTD
jgi:polyvinyl alcohol dehydrogenase (cytochrome)